MTLHIPSLENVAQSGGPIGAPEMTRPHVVERYWGYEVANSADDLNAAVIIRWAAGLSCVGIFFFVWFGLPKATGLFPDQSALSQGIMTLMLLLVAAPFFRLALHSTPVRVQVDTANGELREVVAGLFGSDLVLGHYGMDTVEAIAVAVSKSDPRHGQVQITMRDGSFVAAGAGSLIALRPLRDRLLTDCAVGDRESAREGIWAGPITA